MCKYKRCKCQSLLFLSEKNIFLIYAPVTERIQKLLFAGPNSKYIFRRFTIDLYSRFSFAERLSKTLDEIRCHQPSVPEIISKYTYSHYYD